MGVDAQMFIKTQTLLDDATLLELSWRLVDAFGKQRFGHRRDGREFGTKYPITPITEYKQDGPTLHPEPGEFFYEVELWCRYYGVGYERGPIMDIIAIAEWLDHNLPGCEVWYGGDSSGNCAVPFNGPVRGMLKRHFFAHGHRPYRSIFDRHERNCLECGSPTRSGWTWKNGGEAVCILCGRVVQYGQPSPSGKVRQWSTDE